MVTVKEIVKRLGMHPTSIQKLGKTMSDELTQEELIQFLAERRKPAGAWRPEKAAIADAWYCELTGEVPIVYPGNGDIQITASPSNEPIVIVLPDKTPATHTPRKRPDPTHTKDGNENGALGANLTPSKNWLRSDTFTIVMLLVAIVAQTLHTATFFYFITPVPDSILRYVTAGVVGIGVDAAALVATIQSQRKWYLWTFALIHFGINMSAHFRFADNYGEIDTSTIHFWFDSALLSGAVAFAVYCYSSVFAFKK